MLDRSTCSTEYKGHTKDYYGDTKDRCPSSLALERSPTSFSYRIGSATSTQSGMPAVSSLTTGSGAGSPLSGKQKKESTLVSYPPCPSAISIYSSKKRKHIDHLSISIRSSPVGLPNIQQKRELIGLLNLAFELVIPGALD